MYRQDCWTRQTHKLRVYSLQANVSFSLMIQDLRKYKNGAAKLKDLIQQVLHHLDFDPMDVEHNMHQRLRRAIVEAISK